MKRNIYLLAVLFVISILFSSCNDSISDNTSSLKIEQKPIIEEVENIDGIRVVSITNAEYYLYKMEPLWNYSEMPYGSTIGLGIPNKPDGTSFGEEYRDFNLVSTSSSSLGFFSQGKWELTLYLLDKDRNHILQDPIKKEIYLNSFTNSLKIDMDSQLFVSGNDCSVKLSNFKFELVEHENMYGVEEKGGFKLTVSLSKVSEGLSYSLTPITSFDITTQGENKKNIEFLSNASDNSGIKVVGLINDLTIAEKLKNGSYVMSINLYEYTDQGYVDAGGMTFSFYAISGFVSVIEGNGSTIDLKAADFVTPGAGSGIEIESGIPSSVNVKAYKGVVSEGTLVSSTVSVTTSDTVILVPEVTNGPSSISTYKWFVDGVEQTGTAIDSNRYLTFKPTTAKTYTITYLFLDGTNYNTISGNYYLTVTAAT